MLILPRNIQALACCAGACLQSSFCTWGNFNRQKWGNFNRRKLGNIQPALTQGPLAPRALPRFPATTGPAATVSLSRFCRLYGLPCSTDFSMGRGRFLQLLDMSLPPCCPYHPAGVNMALQSVRHAMLPSPRTKGLGLRIHFCRGHLWVYSRYGPATRSPSQGWLCQSASSISFPPRMRSKLPGF